MKFIEISTLWFITLICFVENANILAIFPMVPKSHYAMFKAVLEGLAKRGHEIDVIGGIPPSNLTGERSSTGNITFIDFPLLSNPDIPEFSIKELRGFTINYALKFMFQIASNRMCKDSFETEVMRKLNDSEKNYDMMMIEIFTSECLFGFANKFKVPVVSMISSVDLPWGGSRIGNPDNPAYVPVYFQSYSPHKSLHDRLWNTVSYIQTKFGHWWHTREQHRISTNFFGENALDLNEIIANTSLLLVNSHFSLNFARPTVPNFIEVGGLHIKDDLDALDENITNFINGSDFIYFSLGTIASSETFEADKLQIIIDTFSEMKYKVLWKMNVTKMIGEFRIPDNVLVDAWMPQLELLCHPNILLFITHAGLMGTQEAVHCGTPMLCMPLFADQYQNCRNMVEKKVAQTLSSLETFTKDELKETLGELIDNKKYRENAKDLAEKFKDRPMKPLETAIYWIEYVIRHKGAPHLKSLSGHLKWYEYVLLDVLSIFILISLICSCIVKLIMRIVKEKKLMNNAEIKKRQ